MIDLDAYLARIDHPRSVAPTLAGLESLILAHVTHVPFENLDIQLGLPIRLDLPSLEAKLVRGRRGGYCFEQNTLFAAVLGQIGFAVETMEARVRARYDTIQARTHMTLRVALPEGVYLADVGFGASGSLVPVPWNGSEVSRHGETYRLFPEGSRLVLQRATAGGWEDLYAIEREPAYPIDYRLGNHYTSTHPESSFVKTLTAQRVLPGVQHVLRNRTYSVTRGGVTEQRDVADPEALLALLRDVFELDFPPGTRFRNPAF